MIKYYNLFWVVVIQMLTINHAECQPTLKCDTVYYWNYYSSQDPTVELRLKHRLVDIIYDGDKILSEVSQYLNDGLWENNIKYTNQYNDHGNQTLTLAQLWKDGNWVNQEKNVWCYDDKGNEIEHLNTVWKNDVWVNEWKNVQEWNEYYKKVSSTYFRWDGIYWVNDGKETITYTADGDESVVSQYDWVYGIWENRDKYSYFYNQDHQKKASVYRQWYEHQWHKEDSTVYSYDSSAVLSLLMSYGFNMVNQEWDLGGRTIIEYSSNYNSMVRTTQSGHEGDWRNFRRDFFTAAPDGTWMPDRLEEWENESWWPIFEIKRYYYDSTRMYIRVNKSWDYYNQLRSWDSTYWVPPAPNGGKENPLLSERLFVFPNPSEGLIRIVNDNGPVSVSIYNVSGEVVYRDYLSGIKLEDIDLSFLPTGLYNIETFDGYSRKTAKVIISR